MSQLRFREGAGVRLINGWTEMRVVATWYDESEGCGYVATVYNPQAYDMALAMPFDEQLRFCASHGVVRDEAAFTPFSMDDKAPYNNRRRGGNALQTNFPQHDFSEGDILMANENTLFRFLNETGVETFCTKLAAASGGRTVVEIKGSGEVKAIETAKLEEVLPYTVGIKYLNGSNTSTTYHFLADEGIFAVTDLLIDEESGHLAKVTEVNSKSKRATRHFKGWKLKADYTSWAK